VLPLKSSHQAGDLYRDDRDRVAKPGHFAVARGLKASGTLPRSETCDGNRRRTSQIGPPQVQASGHDCGRSDFKVEVTEFGDVEIICAFCGGELIHVRCEVIMIRSRN
jgi:hypothetical protein